MKILWISEFYDENSVTFSGGVEARAYFVAKYLRKSGQSLNVISRSKKNVAATADSLWPRMGFLFTSIIDGLKVHGYEMVEGSNFVTYIPAFLIAKFRRIKAVAWYADVYGKTWFTTMNPIVSLPGWLMEWLSLKLPWDQIIAMSETTKVKLMEKNIPEEKITVVYGGVETEKISTISPQKHARPTICTAARLVNYKHIDDLLRAMVIVLKDVPDVRLVVMGDGPERENLKHLSTQLVLSDCVQFMGNLSHEKVIKIMKSSDIFCLPSTVEGFGLVTVEAMAAGLPYVNSDIGPTREITRNSKGGILYPPRDIQALADGILSLLQNKKLYTQKRDEGLKLAKDYQWSTIARQTLAVYRKSLAGD